MSGLFGKSAAAALLSCGAASVRLDHMEPIFLPGSSGRASTKRGKHKPRRHGQKLKSCRVKVGRRVRRKHRRAA